MKFRRVRFKEHIDSPVDNSSIGYAALKADPAIPIGQQGGPVSSLMASIEESGQWVVLTSPKGARKLVPLGNVRDAVPVEEAKQAKKGAEVNA